MKSFLSSIWHGLVFAPVLLQGVPAHAETVVPNITIINESSLQKTPFILPKPTSYTQTTVQNFSEGLAGFFASWKRPDDPRSKNHDLRETADLPEKSRNMLIQKVSAVITDSKKRGNTCAALGIVYTPPSKSLRPLPKRDKLMTLAQISFPPGTAEITVSSSFSRHASWDDPDSAPEWVDLALDLSKKNRDPVMVWSLEFADWDACQRNKISPPGART